MVEEYHAEQVDGIRVWKQLYGWNTINTNIWLPSLSELVGINPSAYREDTATCYSAMQGLNTSAYWHVDTQGGDQLAYFAQYNASGGGEKIWEACNREMTWLRSTYHGSSTDVWRTGKIDFGANYTANNSLAVHPAVEDDLGKALKTINKKAPLWELPVKAPIRPARSCAF